MRKPVILVFINYYLPGYKAGGPVRSIANLIDKLGDNFEFKVITLDRDAGDSKSYSDMKSNEWNIVGSADVYYMSPSSVSIFFFYKLLRTIDHDLVYLNSFFSVRFSLIPLLANKCLREPKPVLIAPRGEFSEGALRLKNLKKKIYFCLSRIFNIHKKVYWHASTEIEKKDILNQFRVNDSSIFIAANIPSASSQKCEPFNLMSFDLEYVPLKLVFISRVTPKKNLDFALRVLAKVKSEVIFSIYGPIWDAAYWDNCQRLIQKIPKNIKVDYLGELRPDQIQSIFQQNDMFVFPTLGENFGHVILESLLAGTPVLISDQSPWKETDDGACTVLPLDENRFVNAIDSYAAKSISEKKSYRRAARAYAVDFVNDPSVLEANRCVFTSIAAKL